MSDLLRALFLLAGAILCGFAAIAEPLPPDATYRPLPTVPIDAVRAIDEGEKSQVMQRQTDLLAQRYDLSDRPMRGVMMSGGRKPVQDGVRVRLPADTTWDGLAAMSPNEIRAQGVLPAGFLPLPHVKQATGGQVFPDAQIEEVQRQEGRNLRRFDVEMDLPEHLRPEFPPPIFLTSHPELGDISHGQLLTIRNFYELMVGLISPVQMEGLRLLLTPFPQEEFNQTEDRKVPEQSLGVPASTATRTFTPTAPSI
jgi:cytochrome c peroxidase